MFGLPLTVIDVGTARLERELESLLQAADGQAGRTTPEFVATSTSGA
jgi:hypothetical protein